MTKSKQQKKSEVFNMKTDILEIITVSIFIVAALEILTRLGAV